MLSAARIQRYHQLKDDLDGAVAVLTTILSPYSNWPLSNTQRLRLDSEISVYKKALEVCSAVYQLNEIGGNDSITEYFRKRVLDAAIAFAGEVLAQNLDGYLLKEQCLIIYEDFGNHIAVDKENSNVVINSRFS